jgi:hypothetical protein
MTQTEAKWAERVRAWREGGRTAEQFAEGQGFEASTLRYWASRLRAKQAGSAAASAPASEPACDMPRVRLVRVRRTAKRTSDASQASSRTAAGERTAPCAALVIALGAARIEVRRGFDARLLSDVVEALGAGQ